MKIHLLLLLVTLFLVTIQPFVFAQDVIVDKKGEIIKVKVIEVNISEIKYKKMDNIEGPLYSIPKSDVLSIHYQNGTKEVFNNVEKNDNMPYKPTDKKNMNAEQRYNYEMTLARRRLPGGIVFTSLAPICIGTGIILIAQNENFPNKYGTEYKGIGAVSLIVGAASAVIGPILLSTSAKHRRIANDAKQHICLLIRLCCL